MLIGYARVSTTDQDLSNQEDVLKRGVLQSPSKVPGHRSNMIYARNNTGSLFNSILMNF